MDKHFLQKTIGTVYKENQSVIFLHSDLELLFMKSTVLKYCLINFRNMAKAYIWHIAAKKYGIK
ncbi:hypothetical protein [Clostridium sp. DMHC 10]|uniref:hypothetical protein n=1 Tax=Clostridium sp. DMHC 10 TaxID=747377 RepID=UPI00069FF4F6|nr:hypothetical protein [Clostridium sp. DMHC 10]